MLKKIIKATVIFTAVGLVLGLMAPAIGGFLFAHGLIGQAVLDTAKASSFIWEGAFFGAFGAVNAAIDPILNGIFNLFGFGDDKEKAPEAQQAQAPQVALAHARSRQMHRDEVEELGSEQTTSDRKFQDRVGGPRAADTSFQERVVQNRPQGDSFQDKVTAARAADQQLSV